jgi:hypothetical protein
MKSDMSCHRHALLLFLTVVCFSFTPNWPWLPSALAQDEFAVLRCLRNLDALIDGEKLGIRAEKKIPAGHHVVAVMLSEYSSGFGGFYSAKTSTPQTISFDAYPRKEYSIVYREGRDEWEPQIRDDYTGEVVSSPVIEADKTQPEVTGQATPAVKRPSRARNGVRSIVLPCLQMVRHSP